MCFLIIFLSVNWVGEKNFFKLNWFLSLLVILCIFVMKVIFKFVLVLILLIFFFIDFCRNLKGMFLEFFKLLLVFK